MNDQIIKQRLFLDTRPIKKSLKGYQEGNMFELKQLEYLFMKLEIQSKMYQKELENYKIYINEKVCEIQSKQEEILNLKQILVEKKANQVQKRQYDEICFQISDYYSTKKTLLEINRINVQILEIQNEIKETDLVLEKKKKLLGIILSQIHSLKID